jgi:hypothetical protein
MENKHGKGLLKPEYRTPPDWSGTNQAPLRVTGTAGICARLNDICAILVVKKSDQPPLDISNDISKYRSNMHGAPDENEHGYPHGHALAMGVADEKSRQ